MTSVSTNLEPKKHKSFKFIKSSTANLGFFVLFTLLFVASFFYFNYEATVNMSTTYFPHLVAWMGSRSNNGSSSSMISHFRGNERPGFLEEGGGDCDVFDGNWVWDESYPLYKSIDCPFMDGGFRCSEHGRPNDFTTKWRWQPKDCNLPRFNGETMLEKLRNRRVVFAGDSLARNNWESLLCMLSSGVSNKSSIYEVNGNPITKHKGFLSFKFHDFNCTVEYYRSTYLVPRGHPSPGAPPEVSQTLRVDQMDWTSTRWRDADLLILSSGHWWNYGRTVKEGCYFQEAQEVKMNMSVDTMRFGDRLRRWSIGLILGLTGKRLVSSFEPILPLISGGAWNSGGGCHMGMIPDLKSQKESSQYKIVSEVISQRSNGLLGVLNVTKMTWRRRDGHPSIYSSKWPNVSFHSQDCSHWCLPGVPDSWNELLYTLFLKHESIK